MTDIRGILFDMDGVLVDSEPVIKAAAIACLEEYGIHAKAEDFVPFIGAGEDRFIGGVAEKYGLTYKTDMKKRTYDIYDTLVYEHLHIFDGIVDTLETLSKRGYRLALSTSADRRKAIINLKVAGIAFDLFDAILSGENVERKKPDPEIFLSSAKAIGIAPENCLVVEDAINGVVAAHSAGAKAAAVLTSFTKTDFLPYHPEFIVSQTKDILQFLK